MNYIFLMTPVERYRKQFILIILLLFGITASAQSVKFSNGSISKNILTISFSYTPVSITDSLHTLSITSHPQATIIPGITFDTTATIQASFLQKNSNGYYGYDFIENFKFIFRGFTPGQHYTGKLQFIFQHVSLRDNQTVHIKNNMVRFTVNNQSFEKKRAQSPSSFIPPSDKCLSISILEDGIYKLTGTDLIDAGVPIKSIPVENYRLFLKNREIPLYISDGASRYLTNNDYVLFYGRKLYGTNSYQEQFSNTSIYRLFWGSVPGLRIANVSGDRRKDPTLYTSGKTIKTTVVNDTLHIEKDDDIRWLGNITDIPPEDITVATEANDNIDNWYWGIIGEKDLTTFSFPIPSPSQNGTARLRINLMGLTNIDSVTPDHNFDCFINGNPAGDHPLISWDGQRSFIFTTDSFPSSMLQHGNNEISFVTKKRSYCRSYCS